LLQRVVRILVALCLLWGIALQGQAKDGQDVVPRNVLTVGVIPQFDLAHTQAIWRPILDELQRRTGYTLILRTSTSIPAFERDLAQGEFDIAYINPYLTVNVAEARGYLPVARDTATDLQGILVVAKESPIQSVEELDGKTVVFPAPNALGATLLLRAELFRRFGVEMVPRYVLSHSSVYLNVALGEAIAGGGVQKTLAQQSPELQQRLRVLYTTEHVPSHPIVIHKRIDKAQQRQLIQALLALGESEQGRALLAKVPIKTIGRADIDDYRPLAEMGLEQFQ